MRIVDLEKEGTWFTPDEAKATILEWMIEADVIDYRDMVPFRLKIYIRWEKFKRWFCK